MTKELVLTPEADDEYFAAIEYYQNTTADVALRFEQSVIKILAIVHHRREPDYWKLRA